MTAVTMATCLTGFRAAGRSRETTKSRKGREFEMKLRTLRVLLALAPALVAACGGAATDDLLRATPSFDSMSMDISDLDAQAPATSTALTIDDASAVDLSAAEACHPHLFLRTHDIVQATN